MNAGNRNEPITPTWSQSIAPVVVKPSVVSTVAVGDRPSTFTARVLHVVNGEHFSGAERVQSHLGRCLPTFGITADFACVKPGKFADMIDEQNGEWGIGHRAAMSGRFDLSVAWTIRRLVRRHEYNLLHAHTPRTAIIAAVAARLAGVPWVYHVHSPASRDSSRRLFNLFNAAVERFALGHSAYLIAVSESLRMDCIRAGARDAKVGVVHNGVPAIRPQRKSPPTPGGRWTLGMVALMRPRKGLEVALEALAKLRDRHDVVLRIIGPFETQAYQDEINALIEQLGVGDRIQRVGFTRDVTSELARLDALVLPSLYGEGLPMVVLEAMAAALPVIATRVEGTPEAITDGVEGLLAQPNDADSLASKIDSLLGGDHDWNRLSQAALDRHGRDFSDVAMAENTAHLYRRVLR